MRTGFSTYQELAATKILTLCDLIKLLEGHKRSGKIIATLNGSFDLLHAGHLHIIHEASQRADILVVALNTDASIKRYKSPSRPLIPLKERMELVAALNMVDYVTWFDEDDPRAILAALRPDIHVNGAEYTSNCIEADTIKSFGGTLHLVNRIPGLSTSMIIEAIQNL
jgi:D-glycero-beta-D-manno-heptose 1-phosphate adenylyltransferase